MRKFLVLVCVMLGAGYARADEISGKYFVQSYSWCNGPFSGLDASNCASYAYWKALDLKRLKSIEIKLIGTDVLLTMEDSKGQVWQKDLNSCNDSASRLFGCNHRSEIALPKKLKFSVHEWEPGSSQRLKIDIENQSVITIFGPDNSMFEIQAMKVP
jgi:hypothetical protein